MVVIKRTYLDEVNLAERLQASRLLNIEDRDDVFMVEIPEQFHLTESSQAEHGVVKRSDLLDRHFLARRLVNSGAAAVSIKCIIQLFELCSYQTTPYAPSPTTS